MPAQNAALYPLKHRVVSPKGERAQVRLTIDTRFTQYHFDRFISVFKIRKKNAVAEHIIMNFKTKAAQARPRRFTRMSGRIFHFRKSTLLSYFLRRTRFATNWTESEVRFSEESITPKHFA